MKSLAAATAEACLAAGAVCAFLPGLAFLAPVAASAFLAPAWLARFPPGRRDVFAPDPLAPDFSGLAGELARRIAAAAAGQGTHPLLLAPFCDRDGSFVPYAVFWKPATGHVVVSCRGAATRRKTGAALRLACPMPIRVSTRPVLVRIAAAAGRAGVAEASMPRPLLRLPSRRLCLALPGETVCKFYLAALLGLYATPRLRGSRGPVELVLLGALPVFLRQVAAFLPHVGRVLRGNADFGLRLAHRFFPSAKWPRRLLGWFRRLSAAGGGGGNAL